MIKINNKKVDISHFKGNTPMLQIKNEKRSHDQMEL